MTSNFVDLSAGVGMVVTDLHGDWQAYGRYRDRFVTLFHQGLADYLILAGDLIHGYGGPDEDASLPMILDVMRLQAEYGTDRIIMLLGNHELPHIYGVTLSKGDLAFTPRFEHALGDHRNEVVAFLKSLPFAVRTIGGVMLAHAGATASITSIQAAKTIKEFSHQWLLDETTALLVTQEVTDLIGEYFNMDLEDYDTAARTYLAVSSPSDPRFLDLLKGIVVSNLREWEVLWNFFFNQCEAGVSLVTYRQVLKKFLDVYALDWYPLRVLVTGHMPVRGGYSLVTEHHLRLASWAHAISKSEGRYLLFDVGLSVRRADELVHFIHQIP